MDKPLREITIGKWKALCDKRTKELREEGRRGAECDGCPMSSVCANTPDEWDLPEEPAVTAPTKPRLAEMLGVEVGERYCYSGMTGSFCVEESGFIRWFNADGSEDQLCCVPTLVNHPESIIRSPRLTEAELAICKAVGAKWVSKDDDSFTVDIWAAMPEKDGSIYTNPDDSGPLAVVKKILFPSVHPGDCICVEEAGEKWD